MSKEVVSKLSESAKTAAVGVSPSLEELNVNPMEYPDLAKFFRLQIRLTPEEQDKIRKLARQYFVAYTKWAIDKERDFMNGEGSAVHYFSVLAEKQKAENILFKEINNLGL